MAARSRSTVRIPARELLTPAQLASLRTRSPWRDLWLIAHAWLTILGAVALVAWWPNPVTLLLAIALIGSRQLGLAVLMHEGAHGCLSGNEPLNMALSQWLCAYPVFAETAAYRRYHLKHHAHTQQEDDPDLALSAPFPIASASYRRKFLRDITGRTGYAQRKAQLLAALGDKGRPLSERAAQFWARLGPQCVCNGLLCAAAVAAGVPWAYPLLWLLPLLTWFMVVTRVRNIAEHAVVGAADDPLRNTRTTLANFLERAFLAPYFVNYHLEHHLFYYVPCYNLPKLHRILRRGPHGARMEIAPGYLCVLSKATSKPGHEDRHRHAARRQANANSVASGF